MPPTISHDKKNCRDPGCDLHEIYKCWATNCLRLNRWHPASAFTAYKGGKNAGKLKRQCVERQTASSTIQATKNEVNNKARLIYEYLLFYLLFFISLVDYHYIHARALAAESGSVAAWLLLFCVFCVQWLMIEKPRLILSLFMSNVLLWFL